MLKKNYHVIGVMSGTSLDGIDFCEVTFNYTNQWEYQIGKCHTYAYAEEWKTKLKKALLFSERELEILNQDYTKLLAEYCNRFIKEYQIQQIDALCSHGHTILHQPENGFTLQIGNLPELATLTSQKIVCNFRVQDVELGGQGAPLVPIGDVLLFNKHTYCLNLGGFANISHQQNNQRIAYDLCAVNVVLNHYAQLLGMDYDDKGTSAKAGKLNLELLNELDTIRFYKEKPPKSLGMEWVNSNLFPILNKYKIPETDILHTYCIHIAKVIALATHNNSYEKILITGGGAYHDFLITEIEKHTHTKIRIPNSKLIEFKEALIFAFLGVLKLENQINVLASVTGASKDHSSGVIFK